MSKPKDIRLRHFLGIIFIEDLLPYTAGIQAPFHEYLTNTKKRDKRPVIWNKRSEKAFSECKQRMRF